MSSIENFSKYLVGDENLAKSDVIWHAMRRSQSEEWAQYVVLVRRTWSRFLDICLSWFPKGRSRSPFPVHSRRLRSLCLCLSFVVHGPFQPTLSSFRRLSVRWMPTRTGN